MMKRCEGTGVSKMHMFSTASVALGHKTAPPGHLIVSLKPHSPAAPPTQPSLPISPPLPPRCSSTVLQQMLTELPGPVEPAHIPSCTPHEAATRTIPAANAPGTSLQRASTPRRDRPERAPNCPAAQPAAPAEPSPATPHIHHTMFASTRPLIQPLQITLGAEERTRVGHHFRGLSPQGAPAFSQPVPKRAHPQS